jgi:signal transduction histidine kinase
MGLQKRISLALTTVIALFVAAQGYLAYLSLEEQEDNLVDEILSTETSRLIERIQAPGGGWMPSDQPLRLGPNLMAWLLPASGANPVSLPEHLAGLSDGLHMMHRETRIYHAAIEPIAEGRLFVQFDATQNEEFVYRFGRYLIVTSLLCIVLGWTLSTFLARVVVSPFRRMSERLRNWTLGERSGPVMRSDEETMLLQAFDQAQRRLEESVVREREFAANVRHEVRTPLSALRTDAEMILLTETLSASSEQRLQRMMASVDSLSSELDGLQSLSSSAPAEPEPVPLAQCVDDVWESLGHLASGAGTVLFNQVPRSEIVELDRLALVTILRNLLRNAIEHGSPGTCTVVRTAEGLLVTDDGPGILPADRPFVFDRYFQGRLKDSPAPGRRDKGLGLAIARQTADLRGWTLELEPSQGPGTVFSLKFA